MVRLLFAVVLLAGCACKHGESRCRGKTIDNCVWASEVTNETSWSSDNCAVACISGKGGAFCSDSATQIAECQKDGLACWKDGTTTCVGGYPTAFAKCEDTVCVSTSACGPVCVAGTQADSRCGPEKTTDGFYLAPGHFCDGATLEACNCGHVAWTGSCGSADLCQVQNGEAVCTLQPSPEPRCGDPMVRYSGFCDGNTATNCWYGYVASALKCDAGACVIDVNGAGCRLN